MKELTVCAWIDFDGDFQLFEAILSYATVSVDNELLIGFKSTLAAEFTARSQAFREDIGLQQKIQTVKRKSN